MVSLLPLTTTVIASAHPRAKAFLTSRRNHEYELISISFRDHPAREVFVTGTFDNWQKTVHLQHNGSRFEKTVELPGSHDRILYKFVVDGHWTPDYNKYHEDDGSGNVNNVLTSRDLTYTSSSNNSHMPGEFPETPAVESEC